MYRFGFKRNRNFNEANRSMKNKDIIKKLKEALDKTDELRVDYFDTFLEDANEYRVSWSDLYNMASEDNCKIYSMRRIIKDLVEELENE